MKISFNQFKWIALVFGVMMVFLSDVSYAVTFGNIGENVANQTMGAAKAAKFLIILIGLIMVGTGVAGIANAKKTQQPLSTPLTILIVGIVMVSVVALIGSGSESIFGNSGNGLSDLGIGN